MSSPLADSPYALAREMADREARRRTPEARADIAAARSDPACAHAMHDPDCAHCETDRIERASAPPTGVIAGPDAALSNAALADTPAVREMGGPTTRQPYPALPAGAVILTGPEAERYRAITAAARKAQASSATARADSAALLQLFQAFCASVGEDG